MAVALLPLTEAHVADLERLAADPDVQRFTRVPSPPPAGFARAWYEAYERGRIEGTREAFAVVDDDGRAFLGATVLPRIDRQSRTTEIGYVVAAEFRGRGIATEALREVARWAFAELEALRLELLISVENDASKRVAARSGFVREGVLRSAYVKPGLREDTEIWSRLTTDPEP